LNSFNYPKMIASFIANRYIKTFTMGSWNCQVATALVITVQQMKKKYMVNHGRSILNYMKNTLWTFSNIQTPLNIQLMNPHSR
jgi:hypothetical protein